jgi:hypothetical protein
MPQLTGTMTSPTTGGQRNGNGIEFRIARLSPFDTRQPENGIVILVMLVGLYLTAPASRAR